MKTGKNRTLIKIASFFLATVLITTYLSFTTSATGYKTSDRMPKNSGKIFDYIEKNGKKTTSEIAVRKIFAKPDIHMVTSLFERKNSKIIFPSFYVYTKCSGIEKRTRIRAFGPAVSIDVNNDGTDDIRVGIVLHPKVVFSPAPALAIMARMSIERINDDISMEELEVAGETSLPRIMGDRSVRFGYFSPAGEEIPKECIVSYSIIPHFLSPRKKPEHLLDFNPVNQVGENSQLVVIASIEDREGNKTTVGINYNPMVHSTLRWGRSKTFGRWHFSLSKHLSPLTETTATVFFRRGELYAGMVIEKISSLSFEMELRPLSKYGGHLYFKKESLRATDIDLFIQTANMSGSLSLYNLPDEVSASWLLRPEGYIDINTYSGTVARVEADVRDTALLSFDPQTHIDLHAAWGNISKDGVTLDMDADVYMEVNSLNFVRYEHENGTVVEIPVIKNGTLHLEGKASIDSYMAFNEIRQGRIGNRSEVDITVENANMFFHAEDTNLGMISGEITLSLDAVDRVKISLLNFSTAKVSGANASWINTTILIDATAGYMHLHTLDIGYMSMFGHVYIKELKGVGITRIYVATIPIYYFTPIIITNAPGTNITLEEFYLEYYDFLPISLYDAQLVGGTCEINIIMNLSDLIFLELANGSNLKHFGVRIGKEQGWGKKLGLPADILPYVFLYFNHPINYIKVHWYSYGPWNSDDWEVNFTYYMQHAYDHNYFLFDTHNNSERLKIGLAMPNNTFGIFIDNKTAIRADNFKLEWNLSDMQNLSMADLLGRISLDGYLNLESVGDEIWLIVNGEYVRLDQLYGGYNLTINRGHIQIGGAKAIILNQTLPAAMAGADVTVAGNFSLDTDDGTIDIWFNSSGVKIAGTVNFTVKDFYLSIGENFTMSAGLFTFLFNSGLNGSVEMTPSPSGSAKISLNEVRIILKNASITFRGRLPVPNVEPEIAIAFPSEGAEVSGVVEIEGNATDSDGIVKRVEVRIDEGEWLNATISAEAWSYSWNTLLLPNGVYRIEARAFDGIDYSKVSTVNVTVNNPGANWRPSASINQPSDRERVEGLIQITGTAADADGAVELVQVRIDDGEWKNATGTTSWSYEWNTTGLVGKHVIGVRAIDNEGAASSISTVTVVVKISIEKRWTLEVELGNACIDVSNLHAGISAERGNGTEITGSVDINRLYLSGGGDIYAAIGPGEFIVKSYGWNAGMNINLLIDGSASANGNSITIDAIANLTGSSEAGPVDILLNKTRLSIAGDFGEDISLNIHIRNANLLYNRTALSLRGKLHAIAYGNAEGIVTIEWNETALKSIEADFEGTSDAEIMLTGIYAGNENTHVAMDRFSLAGRGALDVANNSIEFKGNLDSFTVENLNLVTRQGNISFGVNVTASGYVHLLFNLLDSNNFSFESEGILQVDDLQVVADLPKASASIYVREIIFNASSYLHFEYVEDALGVRCTITASGVYAHDIYLTYNNLSGYCPVIGFEGSIEIFLSSLVHIENGDDWFRIVVEGGGVGYASVHTTFIFNNTMGGIDALIQLQNGDDNFTVYVYNTSGKPCFEVDGSALLSIEGFHVWYGDSLDILIPHFNISFVLEGSEKSGSITIVGVTSVDIDTQLLINGRNLTISGAFQHEGGSDTNLTISWNQSGITGIGGGIAIATSTNITITGMLIGYGNLSISVTSLTINGSMNFLFSSNETAVICMINVSVEATVYQLSVEAGDYQGSWFLSFLGNITIDADALIIIELYR